jgi:hypothetical protein
VSNDRPDSDKSVDLYARARAYDSVRAVLSDDHDRGLAAAQQVLTAVLDESGVDGLSAVAVELAMKLASAIERVAGDQGIAAVDLADVWFAE